MALFWKTTPAGDHYARQRPWMQGEKVEPCDAVGHVRFNPESGRWHAININCQTVGTADTLQGAKEMLESV